MITLCFHPFYLSISLHKLSPSLRCPFLKCLLLDQALRSSSTYSHEGIPEKLFDLHVKNWLELRTSGDCLRPGFCCLCEVAKPLPSYQFTINARKDPSCWRSYANKSDPEVIQQLNIIFRATSGRKQSVRRNDAMIGGNTGTQMISGTTGNSGPDVQYRSWGGRGKYMWRAFNGGCSQMRVDGCPSILQSVR